MLISGSELIRAAIEDGVIQHTQQDYAEFARMLFSLKDEDSIDFADYAGMTPGGSRRNPNAPVDYNDVSQTARIEIKGAGRIASGISRPNIAIGQLAFGSIANIDMTVLLPELERRIDASNEPERTKTEAKSRLRRIADTRLKSALVRREISSPLCFVNTADCRSFVSRAPGTYPLRGRPGRSDGDCADNASGCAGGTGPRGRSREGP